MKHRRHTSYNSEQLREKFPVLATTFEQVLSARKDMYGATSTNYYNKYEGRAKGVSLGLIVEILEENGIKVDIKL